MKFTREQFDEMGKLYLDSFPIDDNNQDLMFELFNHLPNHLQGLAVMWGFDDTVFRDDLFEFLCEKLLDMTCEKYYKSSVFKDYLKNRTCIEINFNKLDEKN